MRILMTTAGYWPEIGGVQTVVMNIARQAKDAGHEVVIVAVRSNGSANKDSFEGVPVHRLPFINPEFSRYLAAFCATCRQSFAGLARIVRDFKPDVINTHFVSTGNSLFSLTVSRMFAIPLVASVHGEDVIGMPLRSTTARLVSKAALRKSAAVTACSGHMALVASRLAGIPLSKITVIRNGVDLAEFDSTRGNDRTGVFSAGRFVHKKGFDLLIKAFAQVKSECPSARLTLAGDGPERKNLELLVDHLGLNGSVEFPGYLAHDEVVNRLSQSAVFVLPSRCEPLGVVVLEAMAAEAPVVAARVGGVPEIMEDGENGLLVDPENPEQLAWAITHLLRDAHLRDELAAEGRGLVEARYSWKDTGRQFLEVLESALQVEGRKCKVKRQELGVRS